MSRAIPFTLLSLSEYARFLQLNPLHFAGGVSALVPANACSDVWKQWSWQDESGKISREQVAQLIQDAERTLTEYLGYWPAPVWIEDERKPYTRPFDPTITGSGFNIRGRHKGLQLNYGKVLYGGRRETELLDDDPVAYVLRDFDGDGFTETAVFTLTVASTLDVCEVKMYFKEYVLADAVNCRTDPSSTGADFAWEIRPIRATLSGTTLTIYVPSWELFSPQLQEGFATADIDADAVASYVDEALVYREYNDPTIPVQFLWGSDIYCDDTAGDCAWITQNGCMRLDSPRLGLATLSPATYNATTELYDAAVWSQGYEPDGVRLWYRAGATEATSSCLVLNRFWADTIAMLATARLNFPICSCSDMAQIVSQKWTTDLAEMTENSTFQTSSAVLQCPFGTRAGEVEAWRRVQKRAAGKAVIT